MSLTKRAAAGRALVAGGWPVSQLWLFWVAPLLGAVLAGAVYRRVFEEK
jgi:aquaporin Z